MTILRTKEAMCGGKLTKKREIKNSLELKFPRISEEVTTTLKFEKLMFHQHTMLHFKIVFKTLCYLKTLPAEFVHNTT